MGTACRVASTPRNQRRRPPGLARDLSVSLNNVGRVALQAGDTARATSLFREAVETYERLRETFGRPFAVDSELGMLRARLAAAEAH